MGKYKKDILKTRINKEIAEKEEQNRLKKKHNITDENVTVVEKSNMVKFTVNTVTRIVKFVATIVLIALAAIGLISIVYPEPRADVLKILYGVFNSVNNMVS